VLRLHSAVSFVIASFLLSVSPAGAQRGSTRGGATSFPGVSNRRANPEIVVEVSAKDEGGLPNALVELRQFGSHVARAFTDSSGRATFHSVGIGTYTATISGVGLETTTVNFSVDPGLSQTVSAEVHRVRGEEHGAPEGMVNAAELNVPKNAQKEYEKGLKDFRDKNFDNAERHFIKALNEYPKLSSAWNNLGTIHMHRNNIDRASDCYHRALEENPNNTTAARNLALLLIMHSQPKEAEQIMRHAIALEPTHSESLTLLAYAELMNGKFDEAIATARKVHTGPNHINSLSHLVAARALEAKKDKAAALEEYKLFLKEVPNAPQAQIAQDAVTRLESRQPTSEHAER
jgi:Flp pilus assembly protein TadD